MRVDVVLYLLLIGVGNGDERVAESQAETVDEPHLGHVDDVGAVYALELLVGKELLKPLHVHQTQHRLLAPVEEEAHIVFLPHDEKNVVETYLHEFVITVHIDKPVFPDCLYPSCIFVWFHNFG